MATAPRHDWYLKAWIKACHTTQGAVGEAAGFSKATMSELVNGKQRYNRDIVNEIADVLHVRPYELLLHPEEAMAIRRFRESAVRLAADSPPEDAPPEADEARFG